MTVLRRGRRRCIFPVFRLVRAFRRNTVSGATALSIDRDGQTAMSRFQRFPSTRLASASDPDSNLK